MPEDFHEGETEWDLRQSRLKLIGKLLEEKTVVYLKCIRNKNLERLQDYFYILKTIYRNVKGYARDNEDHKEKMQEIENLIEEASEDLQQDEDFPSTLEDYQTAEIFENLEKLEDLIQELRMDVGLDIPRKKEYNPENAGVAGLK